ncbi:MAG TPA: AAA family ATPase [Blastocatellia bacterium]|nr:AAA family ATPase [Blastocatellia bacterium]
MKHFGSFCLDTVNQCLWRGDARIPLTRKAFALARHLIDHAGRLVAKEELIEAVWPGVYVQEENLKVYILELRRALGDRARNPSFIETQHGRGYRFIAPVSDRSGVPAPVSEPVPKWLFGREKELKKLQSCFLQAASGKRQIIFITGEAGIGKTALAEAFLQQAMKRPPLRSAIGRCIEGCREREAYYPLLEALGRLWREAGDTTTAGTLAKYAPTWLVQFPALVTPERRKLLQREVLGATRERMVREICEALEAITTETPVVLVLEDLHWADYSTLDLISALARRHEPARLILLATYRPVEVALPQHPLRQLKRELLTHRLCRELPLELLGREAVTDYLMTRFPGSDIPAQLGPLLHEQTEGRPLFMVAAVDYLVTRGMITEVDGTTKLKATLDQINLLVPESLYQFIEQQIEQLTAEEEETLAAASVAGVDFAAWSVSAATGRGASAVEDCCDGLARRQLMLRSAGLEDLPDRSTSACYQFVHSLYRETFYRRLSPAARLRLHRRIGEAMERLWATRAAEIAAELVRHFLEAHDYMRAVPYMLLSADNAARRYALREAVSILESALEVVEKLPEALRAHARIEALDHLVGVCSALGDKLQTIKNCERLAQSAAASGKHDAEARALLSMSHELRYFDAQQALELCERAVSISNDLGDSALRVDAESKVSYLRLALFGWQQELADALKAGIQSLRRDGEAARFVQNAALYVNVQIMSGDYRGVERFTAECLPISARLGDAFSYLHISGFRGWALMNLGQFGTSLRVLRDALAAAERNSDVFNVAFANVFLAWLHCEAFDYGSASALWKSALPVVRAVPAKAAQQRFLVTAAMAETGMGNYDLAQECLMELRSLFQTANLPLAWFWKMPMHCAMSELWLARGDIAAARLDADRLREVSDRNADQAWQARARQLSARVAIAEWDYAQAESDISEALTLITKVEAPLMFWRIHETAADLCGLSGRLEQAEGHRQLSSKTLLDVANSLDEDEPMRQSLLDAVMSRGARPASRGAS